MSVVIPVYNEGDSAPGVVERLLAQLAFPAEILLVYDFDEDNTIPAVQHLIDANPGVRLVRNRYRGVLGAIKTGLGEAVGEAIVVTTADCSDDPQSINRMYLKLQEGYDIVCGSRYIPGGGQQDGPVLKSFLSRMAGLSLNAVTAIPTHDITNGFKMYRREVLRALQIESDGGWEHAMELTIKAYFQGYQITEVPTVWCGRTSGSSKFRLMRWLPKYMRWYWFALRSQRTRNGR